MGAALKLILPPPHDGGQEEFVYWSDNNLIAQCLIAPCGTKVGKSFGSALWLAKETALNPGLFCIWIAPTYLKCKIGYRYLKAMLDVPGLAHCVDGRLEITLSNGSFIKFLHGSDAETTVEGENIDRFIIDESGKIKKQVWYSLFTTITQTGGIGIITGTPRGFNWYYDVYRKAKKTNDPFFVHTTLSTECSPFVLKETIERAKRVLPQALYAQYYLAIFTTSGTVFGDVSNLWTDLELPKGNLKFWVHPDESKRSIEIVHGVDLAKKRDYTVFFSVNLKGEVVGYCRFRHCPYPMQAQRLELYIKKYFGKSDDNMVRFDCTGVGEAVGDIIYELDIDAAITPVTFTNKSKNNMVTRLTLAIEQNWLKCPRIEEFENELSSYELKVTKTGLHSYNAADGEHDDIVCAAMLAVSVAYQSSLADEAEQLLEDGFKDSNDDIVDYIDAGYSNKDDFFDDELDQDYSTDFEFEGTFG